MTVRFDLRPGVARLFRLPLRTRRQMHADIDEELDALIRERVEHFIALGMPPTDAHIEALHRIGADLDDARRLLHRSAEHREHVMRIREYVENALHDFKYALRGLRRSPAFTATAVTTLALGIGANAAMFGLIDRLLFRPPAYLIEPDRVHRLYFARTSSDGSEFANSNTQFNRYLDVSQAAATMDVAAAYSEREIAVGRGEAAREIPVGVATTSLWQLFSARPVVGRFFAAGEDQPRTGSHVVVLSHSYWESQFGASPAAVGKRLTIGPSDYTIIGVAPRGFAALGLAEPAAFVPLGPFGDDNLSRGPYDRDYSTTWLEMYARLRPGISEQVAAADLGHALVSSYSKQLAASGVAIPEFLSKNKPRIILGSPLFERGPRASNDTRVATWLLGVTVVLLLVACANVGNLLLTRGLGRRREIGVRVALGASRARLIGQLIIESLLISMLGGAAGLIVAYWGGGALRATLLPGVELDRSFADARVLVFALCASAFVGLVTGLAPAYHASRPDIGAMLKTGQREGGGQTTRLRAGLMVAQTSLSILLLIGAGLFIRSVRNVGSTSLGFDADRLAWVEVQGRGMPFDTATRVALRERLIQRALSLPGIENAAPAITVPFGGETVYPLFVPGVDSLNKIGSFVLQTAGPTYFATLGTRILRGRGINDGDRQGSERVIVVSESMARRVWQGTDAIGKCVRLGADTAPCRTVVGIAQDVKHGRFGSDAPMLYYVPIMQTLHGQGWFFVRTRGRSATQTEMIRRSLQAIVPAPVFVTVSPVDANVVAAERSWRLGAMMFTIFGVLTLVVASIGLYGLIAYVVAQRTHEMGVRIALGSSTARVVRLVIAQSLPTVLTGAVLGSAGALAGGHWLAPLLFEESPHDPVVFAAVIAVLLAISVAAGWIPARRAAGVDPAEALRAS
jgi:predicted permease